jgi:hypothetical protein
VPEGSVLRLKSKKRGEPAFSAFIGSYFIYKMFGICGFYPGTGRIIHHSPAESLIQSAANQLN